MSKTRCFAVFLMVSTHLLQAFRPLSLRWTRNQAKSFSRSTKRPTRPTTSLLAGTAAASVAMMNASSSTLCASNELFPSNYLQYDHYNGVTLTLTDSFPMNVSEFTETLNESLQSWTTEGRKGIWIHVSASQSDKIHVCLQQGFDFHMVVPGQTSSNKVLVLTKWLPQLTPNRLPLGPTHQVGVGCLIFHPLDWKFENTMGVAPELRRMLVVQEQTGPAAAWKLWKMPTGLADPGEDVHVAAIRECREETGLEATFGGILAMRQAHAQPAVQGNRNVVMRANSDMFVICLLQLVDQSLDDLSTLRTCPDEIAAMQWMAVQEYCDQERWQASPVYLELNKAILNLSRQTLFNAVTLPLGFSSDVSSTNTLYKSALLD